MATLAPHPAFSSSLRDGSLLASGSGFYGSRVTVAAAPKSAVVPTQGNTPVRAVMAPPQPQQRSPASTGAMFSLLTMCAVLELLVSSRRNLTKMPRSGIVRRSCLFPTITSSPQTSEPIEMWTFCATLLMSKISSISMILQIGATFGPIQIIREFAMWLSHKRVIVVQARYSSAQTLIHVMLERLVSSQLVSVAPMLDSSWTPANFCSRSHRL